MQWEHEHFRFVCTLKTWLTTVNNSISFVLNVIFFFFLFCARFDNSSLFVLSVSNWFFELSDAIVTIRDEKHERGGATCKFIHYRIFIAYLLKRFFFLDHYSDFDCEHFCSCFRLVYVLCFSFIFFFSLSVSFLFLLPAIITVIFKHTKTEVYILVWKEMYAEMCVCVCIDVDRKGWVYVWKQWQRSKIKLELNFDRQINISMCRMSRLCFFFFFFFSITLLCCLLLFFGQIICKPAFVS